MGAQGVYERVFVTTFMVPMGKAVSLERGVGSGEWGFFILMFKNSGNHGEGDLLPWIMKLWIWVKFLDLGLGSVKKN
jgi:hypothetical protein